MLKRYHRLIYLFNDILPAIRPTARVGETILYYNLDVSITLVNDCSGH